MAQGPDLSLRLRRLDLGQGPLFQDLSLDVPGGQVLALLGPSGVGKTTLLRLIGGAERRHEGLVRVGGVAAHDAPVPGFVFQDARLLPWLDAAGNLRAVAPGLDDGRIAALLRDVDLAGHAASLPHALSGGMQRRLALARALAVGSGLLLLDEPFVSLDSAAVEELRILFLRVFAGVRPTVVIVSHDPADAARLADRAVVLAGRTARIAADVTLPGVARDRDPVARATIAAGLRDAMRADGPAGLADGPVDGRTRP